LGAIPKLRGCSKVGDSAGEIKTEGSSEVGDVERLAKENPVLEGVLEVGGVKRLARDKLVLEGSSEVGGVERLAKEKPVLEDISEKMKL
jgi:hypothetical protein